MKQPDLGKKISELRLGKGHTQNELASKCKVSLRTIQRIENAKVTPRSHTVKMIFSILEYDFYNLNGNLSDKEEDKLPRKGFFNLIELFNLKTNTMKKLSVISTLILIICTGLFLIDTEGTAQNIDGWFTAGSSPSSYKVGIDQKNFKNGTSSAYIKSIEKKIDGFGTLMQTCSAKEYLGKRVKMKGFIKSKDVANWAGMWLRVDSKVKKTTLSFDNMQDRPIKGNNGWTKCEIVLDVPEESSTLNFGVLLSGTGMVWFDNISFETIDKIDSKITSKKEVATKPMNVDFEQ